jgi:CBS domain-containing protein
MIGSCMKRQIVFASPRTTVLEASRLVVDRRIGTLPIVDEQGTLIGIVQVQDMLSAFMPDFVNLLNNLDFVHDFGALETLVPGDMPGVGQKTMSDLMSEPVAVEQTCGLLRALAVMRKHNIRDLPVTSGAGVLVGIASLVDIAAAFLASWTEEGGSR